MHVFRQFRVSDNWNESEDDESWEQVLSISEKGFVMDTKVLKMYEEFE